MKDNRYEIISNREIGEGIFEMVLSGNGREIKTPGQFIDLRVDGFYLRRPISIAGWTDESLTIVYRVAGNGTKTMSQMPAGREIMALCPLGNGYDLDIECETPLIIGGGLGAAPLYALAAGLRDKGCKTKVILGAKTESELIYLDKFDSENINVEVATEDGSAGIKGFVTDAFDTADYVFACGPEPMLKAVYKKCKDGQFDFEARMACGFGACMGCSCRTRYGSKRICVDGPVLMREEIIW